jgi:gluconolactonase
MLKRISSKTRIGVLLMSLTSMFSCIAQKQADWSGIVAQDATVENLSKEMEFSFLEGPAWDGKGNLYFTDIANNRIWKFSTEKVFSVFRESTNAANGLMFDHQGRLVACEGGAGRLTAMDEKGQVVEILAAEYDGKPFNSLNDLVIDKRGGLYFTDPRFGDESNMPQDKQAVYYRSPGGEIKRVIDNMTKPNGIILSPDGSVLYVVDTYNKFVKTYRISANGMPVDERIFTILKLRENAPNDISGADGLAMDVLGNLYVTTQLGVQVFNHRGHFLGLIQVPEVPANCTFGGLDGKTLFITARKNLYAIKLKVQGITLPLK